MGKFQFDFTMNVGHVLTVLVTIGGVYAWILDTRNMAIQEREQREAAQRATNAKIESVASAIKDLDWKLFQYITNSVNKTRVPEGNAR